MTTQRVYCSRDYHGGVTDEERDHWCEMYHWVTLPNKTLKQGEAKECVEH
jgi:hypothetical protein